MLVHNFTNLHGKSCLLWGKPPSDYQFTLGLRVYLWLNHHALYPCKVAKKVFIQLKTRLRNRLSDDTLPRLMRIAIEGPELESVNFEDILKESNRRMSL